MQHHSSIMSPHYELFSYPSNPTTGLLSRQEEEPLDLSVKNLPTHLPSKCQEALCIVPESHLGLEEKLQTLLSIYDSLSRENSLLQAQEVELLSEINAVREALQSSDDKNMRNEDDVSSLDLRFAVSKGLKERYFVKRRQSSLSNSTASSSASSTFSSSVSSSSYSTCSSEEDNESKMDILVVKKKKKMEQNKLASRRFRERKKAHWSQTVMEADRLCSINKDLKIKASELELKIKWIKEALRKSNDNNNNNTIIKV